MTEADIASDEFETPRTILVAADLGTDHQGQARTFDDDASHTETLTSAATATVNDDDTAQVMGLTVTPGDARLVMNWTAVDNATGYTVQWKSGNQGYNTTNRQATVTSGTTTSHTITGLSQRHRILGAGERDPDRRQRRPAVGGGARAPRPCRPRPASRCRRRR